jgi:hypothetical protein
MNTLTTLDILLVYAVLVVPACSLYVIVERRSQGRKSRNSLKNQSIYREFADRRGTSAESAAD